jgi:hypothetical protein
MKLFSESEDVFGLALRKTGSSKDLDRAAADLGWCGKGMLGLIFDVGVEESYKLCLD